MATMNISLPDPLRDFVEQEVARGGYASASEYMRELVRKAKGEKELESRLLEALDGEDLGEIGPDFIEKLREHARATARKRRR